MHDYCENPLCENPSVKKVPVSVDKPSDQVRTLCTACEEAYTWDVQHGRIKPGLNRLNEFLLAGGFVVLGRNRQDPDSDAPFEAWAYRGPLDFQITTPVVFGVGAGVNEALHALDTNISTRSKEHERETDN